MHKKLEPEPEPEPDYQGLDAPRCPNCDRVMSHREFNEQGCCNDCYDGTITWSRR